MQNSPAQTHTQPIIRLKDVAVQYPNGVKALNRLSLDIQNGVITVLLGPSGAGKSTLLRSLNLLVRPSNGQVLTEDGTPLDKTEDIRAHRCRTAMVFQQHQLIGRMTTLQNVLMARLGRYSFWRTLLPFPKQDRRLAIACLERVGLFEKLFVRCNNLSGGQQQRVGIARALAQQPDMILADEPVASLDPKSSHHILSLLQQVCRQDRIPVVISLHQLDYAREFADRIIGLAAGNVVFDGPPSALDAGALARIYDSHTESSNPDLKPVLNPEPTMTRSLQP